MGRYQQEFRRSLADPGPFWRGGHLHADGARGRGRHARVRPGRRGALGPVAALRRVDVAAALPKARSGKILRKAMRGIADGHDEPVTSTIKDPAALDALRPLLHGG